MSDEGGVRLPRAFDDLRIGITLHDPATGAVLDGNERLAELYGYPLEELRTMNVEDYTAPSTRFTQREAVERIRAAAGGDPQVFEWQIERANEELRWVRVQLNRTTLDGDDYVLAEVQDITAYRARERRLRLLSRVVRHNLRNKTNVLLGYAERVKTAIEDERLEAEVQTILDITMEVGTLSDSVREIEEIAEPDATERSPTDLRELVDDLVADAAAAFPSADLTVDGGTDIRVIVDKGVAYAVRHALENAIDHNDRPEPSVTVSVVDDPEHERGIVRIADDGPTIPDHEIDVLNEDVETSSTYHGTGVGLWVIQWCVDSLGGELTFDANDPRGNVVSIALPKAAD
ncbi:PAS domain S-box protein [Halorubrum sp. JWXQ-INN 858]|uniref:PAS domain-containing sensor histidine kinase n=1 Tax=Halorubrum sp. JWXQ-INN 858 TaxID=2690782 RepID=UPI00135887E2|nr:PAS domain-containing sensor histidine kinase [Halorubrum sp. JWXQ-INN 858]MWV65692.1 PAS domain S-box protein [Halorubrum sp. JWXQ-INN 858]